MMMWIVFIILIVIMLGIDLFAHRHAHIISFKEAALWSIFWITLALLFSVYIYFISGHEASLNYLTGYLIEKSLSIDNLFVFLLVFNYFNTPLHLLHKVLFWGVLGAIVMRGVFIALGIALLENFHWIIYIFGVFLVYSGIKFGLEKNKKINLENNWLLKLFRRMVPMTQNYQGDRFFVKIDYKYFATPLLVVLAAVEIADLIFAIDSIPA